jgi:hypothetical protein
LPGYMRSLTAGLSAGVLATAVAWAQPSVLIQNPPSAAPTVNINQNAVVPPVTVAPGPEPWYTVFTTGEVIGFIEPCG